MSRDIPYRSPFDAFAATAARRPDAPFLLAPAAAALPYAPDGFSYAYGLFKAEVDRLRNEYAAAGYGHGARVALLLENRPVFFLHWLALNALGVSIVPINPDVRPDELSYQLELSEADLLVATPDRMHLTRDAALGRARLIDTDGLIPLCRSEVIRQTPEFNDECALLFTSGSTGKPKGCMLSNRYFLQVADWYLAQGGVAELQADREINLTPLPMFHMNALGCSAVGMMVLGGAVVPLDRFHATRWWQCVAESGATIVHCLGVIPAILLQLPTSEIERQHRVRFAFAPGVDARHRATFEERYRIPIVEAWAMTETGGAAATTTAREPAGFGARCVGRPHAGMEHRLVDDQGADVALGKPGELLVRAKGDDPRAGFFSGYLKDKDATAAAWQGGWFHTGDLVFADEDGLMYFFDRKKTIVRRSGENIGVLEVESALYMDTRIGGCAVTPVPDDIRGEEVFAFIVPNAKADDTEALATSIVTACAERLAYHKVPGYVAIVDELPLSSTRKLARGEIKTLAAAAVAAGRASDLRKLKAKLRQG
ncbi:AMP-binding protein [Bradyrhizobium sp. WSM 1704]|uniref:AMP-binding protein n=1 Tax=Bradyrhizobium semiaridum TaxID=2821404 RepID=UPI001CE2886C|nr:AMP-binding protein [Bradyrhizobium semiaridum]MCA6121386.1 AMP-binding protein [Bradyrhizobium semiaridum]